MILAVDVQYSGNNAIVAGVVFENWQDEKAQKECVSMIDGVAGYEPGNFSGENFHAFLNLLQNII